MQVSSKQKSYQLFPEYAGILGDRILPWMALAELLRKTEQKILDVERRIEVQRAIVAKTESGGYEVGAAREVLRALQRSHLTLVMHWKQLHGTMGSSARGTSNDLQRLAAKLVEKSAPPIDDETEHRARLARH